jgi:hypothetical protein
MASTSAQVRHTATASATIMPGRGGFVTGLKYGIKNDGRRAASNIQRELRSCPISGFGKTVGRLFPQQAP